LRNTVAPTRHYAPQNTVAPTRHYAPLPGVGSPTKRPAYLAPGHEVAAEPRYARAATAAEYAPRHAVAAREYVPQPALPYYVRPEVEAIPAQLSPPRSP